MEVWTRYFNLNKWSWMLDFGMMSWVSLKLIILPFVFFRIWRNVRMRKTSTMRYKLPLSRYLKKKWSNCPWMDQTLIWKYLTYWKGIERRLNGHLCWIWEVVHSSLLIVHEAFQTGNKATDWEIYKVHKAMLKFFNGSTTSTKLLLELVKQIRFYWGNVQYIFQFFEIWIIFLTSLTLSKIFKKYTEVSFSMILASTNCGPDADRVRSGAQSLWDASDFSVTKILPCKKEKVIRSRNLQSMRLAKQWKTCSEFQILSWIQHICDILIFIYLMSSKSLYVLMDWVTFNSIMTEIPIM